MCLNNHSKSANPQTFEKKPAVINKDNLYTTTFCVSEEGMRFLGITLANCRFNSSTLDFDRFVPCCAGSKEIPWPSHNALLPLKYFVQVVMWVISDEKHLFIKISY